MTEEAGPAPSLEELVCAAERARAAFDWEATLSHTGQALKRTGVPPETVYALLEAQAEAHRLLGDLATENSDREAMSRIAAELGDAKRQARVMVRRSELRWRQGAFPDARRLAQTALDAARDLGDAALEAAALCELNAVDTSEGLFDQARRHAERALALYTSVGDALGQARALFFLAVTNSRQERITESLAQMQAALDLFRRHADREGEGRALNGLGIASLDLAQKRVYYEHALIAYDVIGSRRGLAQTRNNLALTNTQMGLYALAREDAAEAVAAARRMGARNDLAYYLDTLARACMDLGEAAESEALNQEGLALCREIGDVSVGAGYTLGLARAHQASGHLPEACALFRQAADLYESLAIPAEQGTCLAWLGEVYREMGDVEAARAYTAQAVSLLETCGGAGAEYPPQEIWWRRYQALAEALSPGERIGGEGAVTDDAWHALDRALNVMLAGIANLSDDGLRRNYLNKVSINRQIVGEWLRQAARRGVPLAPLTDALTGPAGGQEQFRRMLDIGLRLNARRETADLARFIVDHVVELTGAERVVLYRPDGAADRHVTAEFSVHGVPPYAEPTPLLDEVSLKRQALLRYTPADAPALEQRSQLCVPLVAAGKLVGLVYADMAGLYGRFSERDRDLLSVLANQAAVALENAVWAESLEQRVKDRTAELQSANALLGERTAELEIINSVQHALAAQLDVQAIYDLVGDKIRDIFDAQVVSIVSYDHVQRLKHERYAFERGEKPPLFESQPFSRQSEYLIATRQPICINANLRQRSAELGMTTVPGTEEPKSVLFVPLIAGNEVKGTISLQNLDHENAFSESDVRLLTTLAGSMSVALENARLFDETSRLLAETQQRTAELEIINSVQEALASQLDMQAIYDLVGNKIRDIFDAQAVTIFMLDYAARLGYLRYGIEKGQRIHAEPAPFTGFAQYLIATRRPVLINEDATRRCEELGMAPAIPGTEEPKSMLFVPLIAGNQVTGIISLQNVDREQAFSEPDVRLLTTLAGSMSVALENARLFDETNRLLAETQRRTSELEIINRVGTSLARQLDSEAIVSLVGERLREVFPHQMCSVALYDKATDTIHWPYFTDIEGNRLFPEPVQLGVGLTSNVIRTRGPHRHGTLEEGKAFGSVWVYDEIQREPQSWIGVPILVGDEAIGVLAVQDMPQNRYTDNDVRLLATLASSMGVALENARLFAETNRLLDESRQRAAEMATVNRISQALASQLDLDALIQLVGEQIREVFQADIAYVALVDRQTELIRFPYMFGEELRPLKIGEGLTSRILASGQPLLINEGLESRRTALGVRRVGIEAQSYLGVPVMVGDEAIGVLSVQSTKEEGRFDQDDLRLLSTIAASVGTALQKARLYQETQRRAAEMAALAELGREISATLDLQAVLDRIAGEARELLSAGSGAVYLLQADGYTLKAIAASGQSAQAVLADETQIGCGIIGHIVEAGVAERIDDTTNDPRGLHIPGTEETPAGEKLMVAPLLVQDRAIGALAVWRDPEDPVFNQADLSFAIGLAQQAAVAIQNARLFEAAQESRRRMADIIDFLPDATLVIDREGKVIAWNRAIEEMTGVKAADMVGRDDYEYAMPFYGERRPILIDLVLRPDEEIETRYTVLDRQGAILTSEALVPHLRGAQAYLYATASALRNAKGEIVGAIETIRDISDRRRAEEELRQAKAAAESATQAKSAFLATMSHEIRTPMNAVIGMTSLLLDTPLTAEQRDFAETIRTSGDSLLSIINDILDFSKIEAGRLDLESTPFDLRECVEGALDLLAPKAREKNLNLAYLIDAQVPAAIIGDMTRLRQILVNLVGNSCKFTDQGEVVVSVAVDDRRQESPSPVVERTSPVVLHFSVRDTGVGIPPDRMDRLFQSFSQVDSSTTRRYGGTGLGLAISLRLAEMMGGTMWAESPGVPGQGSTFHFTIQARPASLPVRAELRAEAPDLQEKRVLIVDDNATNRRILTLQTQGWGMLPRATGSPFEAVDWLREGEAFDVGLIDRQMPDMDGLALALEIRKLASQMPLIMVSSLGQREAGVEAAGLAAFLLKPIKPSQLFNTLVGLFAKPSDVAKTAVAARQFDAEMGKRHPLRILLAEDNAVNQKLALRLLERLGYRADVAANGVEAIRAIERQPYDLVFMDVQMPEMDGLEATRQICARWAAGERPRIVAMTANALAEDREACLAAGMDDYLAKPIRVEEMVEALGRSAARAGQ